MNKKSLLSVRVFIFAIGLSSMVFILQATWPGFLYADSLYQLGQAQTGHYDDWHLPFMSLLWVPLLKLAPGPAGYLVLDTILIWSSIIIVALIASKRLGPPALALVLVPLMPGCVNYLGNISVDTLLVAWLLATSCAAYLADRGRSGIVPRVLANLFALCAFLTRPNALLALVPLLVFGNYRLGRRRCFLFSISMLIMMPVTNSIIVTMTHATRLHTEDAVLTYTLLELSYEENRNLFPGQWSAEQSKRIVSSCYSPVQWDSAWIGECSFISKTLRQQQLWGTSTMILRYLKEIALHPAAYVTMLLPTFQRSLFWPNSFSMFYQDNVPKAWLIPDHPPRSATVFLMAYVTSDWNWILGRTPSSIILSLIVTIIILRKRLWNSAEERLAIAILLSGLFYLASLFPSVISAEFRYFYWCSFASMFALVLAGGAAVGHEKHRQLGTPIHGAMRAMLLAPSCLAVATLVVCVVFCPPHLNRRIFIAARDDRQIRIIDSWDRSTPAWIRGPLKLHLAKESVIRTAGLEIPGNGHISGYLDVPFDDLILKLATGPGLGVASIDTAEQHLSIDTASLRPDSLTVVLNAPYRRPTRAAVTWSMALLCSALCCLYLVNKLVCFSIPGRRS